MRLLTLFMAALWALFAQAETNQMSMSDRIVLSGDTLLLPVVLDNESEISAFQCDVFLPQGITVALNEEEDLDVTLNSERATSSHSITARPQDDGCIRLAAYSSQSKKFKGNSGELFYLNLVTDADVEGEMSITLKNIICSTADAEEIAVPDAEALITMAKYIPKNDFILNDTSFLGGTSILLPVGLDNESEISAFQCDICLPEGITLLLNEEEEFDITLNGERTTSSHSPSARLQDNGSIRLAVYSSQSKKFKGNTGELFYLHLHADKEHFGAQQICIQNIICSTADAKTIIVNEVKNTLTILRPVETLTLDQQTAEVVRNETLTLNATVAPEDADNKEITWTSSDETVATVKDGVVTALKVGEAIITATTTDGTNLTATCTVTVKPIVVSALTLDQQTAEVVRNETLTLTATVAPEDADNKEIAWTSSDETVATVKDGVVTALKVGEAIITATTTDGTNLTATCTVTVKPIVVSALTLDQQTAEVVRNETLTLTVTVAPEDADNKEITWTSSDETVATVKDGVVTALKVGEAIITATTTDGTNLTATCTVTVKPIVVSALTLDQQTAEVVRNETLTLTATVAPEDADNKEIAWTSSDETVATVKDGVVTALKVGEAIITATTTDGTNLTATCTVTVKPVLLTSITLNIIELTLEVGETALLTATVAPEEADNKSVVWSSSDASIVTVDQTGLVTYVKEGTATINATAADGSGITATCAVVAKPDGITTITSDNIANITYYSIVGEASDTPHKGLNIIKRAYKDGRVEVSKRIIK